MSDKENQDPKKEEETGAAEEAPEKEEKAAEVKEEKPKPKKRARKEDKEEKPEKKAKKAVKKAISNLARKKQDPRFEQNGKGRYVSKKKSENGRKNVQARAIKCSRQLLDLGGQMVLLGRGAKGVALLDLTRKIRSALKEGLTDEKAVEKFKEEARKMIESYKAEESK